MSAAWHVGIHPESAQDARHLPPPRAQGVPGGQGLSSRGQGGPVGTPLPEGVEPTLYPEPPEATAMGTTLRFCWGFSATAGARSPGFSERFHSPQRAAVGARGLGPQPCRMRQN